MTRRVNERMSGPRATMRDRAAITRFFDGLELLEPGVVQPQQWRPDPGCQPAPGDSLVRGRPEAVAPLHAQRRRHWPRQGGRQRQALPAHHHRPRRGPAIPSLVNRVLPAQHPHHQHNPGILGQHSHRTQQLTLMASKGH
jgi:hypothetical protein